MFSREYGLLRVYDEGTGPDINLLHHNNHYSIVTTLPGFFGRSFYCVICKRGYNNKRQHAKCGRKLVYITKGSCLIKYNFSCPCCYEKGRCDFDDWIRCGDCNKSFFSDRCYDNHKRIIQYKDKVCVFNSCNQT